MILEYGYFCPIPVIGLQSYCFFVVYSYETTTFFLFFTLFNTSCQLG